MNASAEHRLYAKNLSQASENKIHDDDVARRFGFAGALVGGIEVYAYMTHLPLARWGIDWLERGTSECRFFKPVYDGKLAVVSAIEDAGALAITVTSEGETCARGAVALPPDAAPAPAIPEPAAPPSAKDRPDADETTLAVGRRLSSHPLCLDRERLQQYLADVSERDPIYARENIVHAAFILKLCNLALKDNVKLAAWIHVGSTVRHCGIAHAGDTLAAHAVVAANHEKKGHRFVELDATVVANGTRPLAQVRHVAIYRIRREG